MVEVSATHSKRRKTFLFSRIIIILLFTHSLTKVARGVKDETPFLGFLNNDNSVSHNLTKVE